MVFAKLVGSVKGQAAIDFMVSYGIALLIIVIAVAIIYKIGLLSPYLAAPSCTTLPGFECGLYAVNTNGILRLQLFQSTGGTITVGGIACASQQNTTGDLPAFGNIHVTSGSAYYPPSNAPSGASIYSGSAREFNLTCYGPTGIESGYVGDGFFSYIWLNYTVPGYGATTQEIGSITTKYT